MRCLVTGATGYIGSRLVPRLLAEGHTVRCLTRSAGRLRDVPWAGRMEIAQGDLTDPPSVAAAMTGIEVAYYLVHLMGGSVYTDVRQRPVAAPPDVLWRVIEGTRNADGWRVERLVPGRLLRLRSTTRLPGRAWLEMGAVARDADRSRYLQRVVFAPHGLVGHVYWAVARLVRGMILGGTARGIATAAERGRGRAANSR